MKSTPEQIESEYRATAFHEAGHAVALLHYGQQTHVWMMDRTAHEEPEGLEFLGRCEVAIPYDIPRKQLGQHQQRVVKVAGPLAELLSDMPEFIIDGNDDYLWVELAFAMVFNGNDDLPKTGGDRELIRAQKDAIKIIREWWPVLRHVAEELMRRPGPGWSSFSYIPSHFLLTIEL